MRNVMKFLAVFVFMTATLQAQEKPSCCAKKLEKKVEMMKQKLSLSDSQVSQITLLLKEPNANFTSDLKNILTAEQYTQFELEKSKKSCCKKDTAKKNCESKSKKESCCSKKQASEKKSCCKKDIAAKKSCNAESVKKSCCKKK